MNAEIITIGTELLLGDIVDTNSRVLAQSLRQAGIDLFRTTSIGDNPGRIADAIREAAARSSVVITTGGLGPTVDDPTRQAAADAFGVGLEFHESLWLEIQDRFARFGRTATENNRQQAYLPEGAAAIHNPVGTAPGFILEGSSSVVIALPGVPAEMAWLLDREVMPYLARRFGIEESLQARILHTAGVGESWVDERIQDLETMNHPTVGILAHPGRVDVRIAAKGATPEAALSVISPVEVEIRRRLGEAVFGADSDRLETVTLAAFASRGWRLASLEAGTNGALAAALSTAGDGWAGGMVLAGTDLGQEDSAGAHGMTALAAEALLSVGLSQPGRRADVTIRLRAPEIQEEWTRKYGGALLNAAAWSVAIALDLARRRLA